VTLAWLVAVLLVEVEGRLLGGGGRSASAGVAALLGASAATEVVPVAIWGRTLGKALLGLRVVRAADGGQPGPLRSLVRWVVLFGALAVPAVGWAVALVVAGTRLHDRLAGTTVVDAGRDAGGDGRRPG
jgi:uncharacterized RDD family membrane protein YckC